MKKTGIINNFWNKCIRLLIVLTVFCCLYPLYGTDNQRSPIDINLIIDGSASFAGVREEVTAWVLNQLDQMLAEGDKVTVWNAGQTSRIVYNGKISNSADKEAVRKIIREFSASGNSTDFSGALREASRQAQGSEFCYTLLISATPAALSSLLSGPQADLLRFSRVEEFSGWRALVVGLNLDSKVKQAAAGFYGL